MYCTKVFELAHRCNNADHDVTRTDVKSEKMNAVKPLQMATDAVDRHIPGLPGFGSTNVVLRLRDKLVKKNRKNMKTSNLPDVAWAMDS